MKRKFALILLIIFISISTATALAAANFVPVTHMVDQNTLITISELAPPECDSIRAGLGAAVIAPATVTGTN